MVFLAFRGLVRIFHLLLKTLPPKRGGPSWFLGRRPGNRLSPLFSDASSPSPKPEPATASVTAPPRSMPGRSLAPGPGGFAATRRAALLIRLLTKGRFIVVSISRFGHGGNFLPLTRGKPYATSDFQAAQRSTRPSFLGRARSGYLGVWTSVWSGKCWSIIPKSNAGALASCASVRSVMKLASLPTLI